MVLSPLNTIEMTNSIDVTVSVTGGGGTGQAGAIRHGLSRALEKNERELRVPLKKRDICDEIPEKSKERRPDNPGQERDFNFQKDKIYRIFFSPPLGTPTGGFVFKDISRNLNYECLHHWSIRLFGEGTR